jgi:hypothetical protein
MHSANALQSNFDTMPGPMCANAVLSSSLVLEENNAAAASVTSKLERVSNVLRMFTNIT